MTSTPTRSGMPGHFGIRITDADKDKLVDELDADDRHLNNSGHVHGGALAAFADDLGGALAGLNVLLGFRTRDICAGCRFPLYGERRDERLGAFARVAPVLS